MHLSLSTRWLSERRRAGLTATVAIVVAAVLSIIAQYSDVLAPIDINVVVLLAYLSVYLVITLAAFGMASPTAIRQWAHRTSRGTALQRYVFGTAPGPGVSIFIAAAALGVAVFWLPARIDAPAAGLRVGLAGALVAIAWLSVVVSFAVTFQADTVAENDGGLLFPGGDTAVWIDYFYFAVSVMTTFGTTDVAVTSSTMRRTVTINAVIAFVFNTVTVAALVSTLTTV